MTKKERFMTLEWKAFIYDFNKKSIKSFNIFRTDLFEDIKKAKCRSFAELKKVIDKWAQYHYWSRTEYEIAIGGLFSKYPEEFEKVDVYRQIKMNLDRITEYVGKNLGILED